MSAYSGALQKSHLGSHVVHGEAVKSEEEAFIPGQGFCVTLQPQQVPSAASGGVGGWRGASLLYWEGKPCEQGDHRQLGLVRVRGCHRKTRFAKQNWHSVNAHCLLPMGIEFLSLSLSPLSPFLPPLLPSFHLKPK